MFAVKGSENASNPSDSSPSGGVEKIAVVFDRDIDAETADARRWKLLENAWELSENRPIARITDQVKTKTLCRAIITELW